MPSRQRRVRRDAFNDVERCIAGHCIGQNCPCLCHVETLRLAHTSSDDAGGFVASVRGVKLERRNATQLHNEAPNNEAPTVP
jgi:hypothetical protein